MSYVIFNAKYTCMQNIILASIELQSDFEDVGTQSAEFYA